jgi:WD40 repeat protein
MIRIWGAKDLTEIGKPWKGHTDTISTVHWNPKESFIASGGTDRTIRIWTPLFHRLKNLEFPFPTFAMGMPVSWSPDGKNIAVASYDSRIMVWEVGNGTVTPLPSNGQVGRARVLAWSPDGRIIASAGDEGAIHLWDVGTKKLAFPPLRGHTGPVLSLSWNPNGKEISSGGVDRTIRVWSAETGKQSTATMAAEVAVTALAWSPDGRRIASAGNDKNVIFWDPVTSKSLRTHVFTPNVNYALAWNKSGSQLAIGGAGGHIAIIEKSSGGSKISAFTGHSSFVRGVSWSPDGRYLVSSGDDGSVKYWDALTHGPIGMPEKIEDGPLSTVSWGPDGMHVLSNDIKGRVRVSLSPSAWIEKICSTLTRNFSPEEWDYYVDKNVDYTVQCPGLPVPKRGQYPVDEVNLRQSKMFKQGLEIWDQ